MVKDPMLSNSSSQQFEMHIVKEAKPSAITADANRMPGGRDGPMHKLGLHENRQEL